MNIRSNLFKIYNTVKYQSAKLDKQAEAEHNSGGLTGETGYLAAYYGGARDVSKLLLKIYNGEMSESKVEDIIKLLNEPKFELIN